jgi:hypothetical protein
MTEDHNTEKKVIGAINACVDPDCTGWLVDSFLGKYWIECLDARHNRDKKEKPQQNEFGVDRSLTQFAEVVSDTRIVKEAERSKA